MHKTITSNPLEAKIAFETSRFHFYFSLWNIFQQIFFFHPTLYDSCLKSSLLFMFSIPIFMLFVNSFVLKKNYQVKSRSAYNIQKVMLSRFNESKFGLEVHKFIYFVYFVIRFKSSSHFMFSIPIFMKVGPLSFMSPTNFKLNIWTHTKNPFQDLKYQHDFFNVFRGHIIRWIIKNLTPFFFILFPMIFGYLSNVMINNEK